MALLQEMELPWERLFFAVRERRTTTAMVDASRYQNNMIDLPLLRGEDTQSDSLASVLVYTELISWLLDALYLKPFKYRSSGVIAGFAVGAVVQ